MDIAAYLVSCITNFIFIIPIFNYMQGGKWGILPPWSHLAPLMLDLNNEHVLS